MDEPEVRRPLVSGKWIIFFQYPFLDIQQQGVKMEPFAEKRAASLF